MNDNTVSDRELEEWRRQFAMGIAPVETFEIYKTGKPDGTVFDSTDPSKMFVRDSSQNWIRVERRNFSANTPPDIEVFIGNTNGYNPNAQSAVAVAYPAMDDWSGANYQTAWVGDPGAIAYAGDDGNLYSDSNLFAFDDSLSRVTLRGEAGTGLQIFNQGTEFPFTNAFSSRGDLVTPAAIQSGDLLYNIGVFGYGATTYGAASIARIRFYATENYSDTARGSELRLYTTPNTTTAAQEVLILGQGGQTRPVLGFAYSGVITPAQIAANVNNYNPVDGVTSQTFYTAVRLRISTDASRNITGLAATNVIDGQIFILDNVGSNNAVLKDEDTNSTAANRFSLVTDLTLAPTTSIIVIYDGVSSRFRLAGGAGSGSGGSGDVTGPGSATDNALARFDGTTGKIIQNSGVIVDDTDNVTGMATLTLPNTGLHLLDTNASHDLIIAPGSDLTADRTLTITTGDSNRTLTLTGNATLNQDVSSTGTPTFGSLTLSSPLIATSGGTGFASYAVGDLLYASTTTALSKLADVATGNALISGGIGVAPAWGKIALATHVSGTLPATNGGTGLASYTQGDILYASSTTALSALADVATGNALISGGVGLNPSWGKIALTTHVSGTLPGTNGGTGVNNGSSTFTYGGNTNISGGGTISLGGFTFTVPNNGTAALGTGANTRVAFWTGTNDLSSDTGMTFDSTANTLSLLGGLIRTEISTPSTPAATTLETYAVDAGSATRLAGIDSTGSVIVYDGLIKVTNTSGTTAAANDAGYITTAGEYKTTTTAALIASWCVVIVGGANNADIFVARRGRVTVNVTTGVTAGQFLQTSTTAGRADGRDGASPSIFAIALTSESSNVCSALLLCGRTTVPYVSTNDIIRLNAAAFIAAGSAQWTGTINDASPTSNPFTVATVTGSLANITPVSSSELGKIRLYNSTRSNSILIQSISGNDITATAAIPVNWVNGDTLTVQDTTIGSGYRGIDMTGQTEIPVTAVSLIPSVTASDSLMTTTSVNVGLHPYETAANSKIVFVGPQVATVFIRFIAPSLPLYGLRFGLNNLCSGASATQVIIVRVNGWIEATP